MKMKIKTRRIKGEERNLANKQNCWLFATIKWSKKVGVDGF
jgi:hypothetical protein